MKPDRVGLPCIHHKKRGYFPFIDHKKQDIPAKKKVKKEGIPSDCFSANSFFFKFHGYEIQRETSLSMFLTKFKLFRIFSRSEVF
jgi:hypothetical protein